MMIFPAIDLRGGRVVRLEKGRFDSETVYGDDPVAVAAAMAEAGARRLHVVDLDGAEKGSPCQTETIAEIGRATGLHVQAGGGIRRAADASQLLDAGIGAVVVGSLAVREPETFASLLAAFGGERIVLAADCRVDNDGRARIATSGWSETTESGVRETVERFSKVGLLSFLCTDVDRDGMLEGPNFDLYAELVRELPGVELIASGGVRGGDDLERVAALGCGGAIVGKAIYEGRIEVAEAVRFESEGC